MARELLTDPPELKTARIAGDPPMVKWPRPPLRGDGHHASLRRFPRLVQVPPQGVGGCDGVGRVCRLALPDVRT